jgi:hypothetical protein
MGDRSVSIECETYGEKGYGRGKISGTFGADTENAIKAKIRGSCPISRCPLRKSCKPVIKGKKDLSPHLRRLSLKYKA